MWEFNQSLKYDKRMRAADIRGSIAYTKALRLQGVYTEEEEAVMIKGLQEVDQEWESGKVGHPLFLSNRICDNLRAHSSKLKEPMKTSIRPTNAGLVRLWVLWAESCILGDRATINVRRTYGYGSWMKSRISRAH